MAHGAPRFPISVKVEERSRSPSERELCALQMDFTVSTKEEQRGANQSIGLRVTTCRLHLNLTCDIVRICRNRSRSYPILHLGLSIGFRVIRRLRYLNSISYDLSLCTRFDDVVTSTFYLYNFFVYALLTREEN